MKRVGILGGMYNPVHDGHLRAAIEARELLGLDEVRLVPCASPPHREAPAVSATLRAEMVEAAVADIEVLKLDARELELPPPSYTVRTLESLRAEMPGAEFVLLLGEDAFRGFHRWHEWQKVAQLARIAVMRRPGNEDLELPASLAAWLEETEVAHERLFDGDAPAVTFCEITALDISSTRIRELRAANRDPRFLVPDAVLDIIERENLYKDRN
ncbi:MAG TPA: nicotinate-nucleotide adenylyltransferase [Gammaproteobacteria bacterium]